MVASSSRRTEGALDVSCVYLETFVALLKRFDEFQLVHNLREVVTIWLISAISLNTAIASGTGSDLSPEGGNNNGAGTTELLQALQIEQFSLQKAAHALLVLNTAARYGLIDYRIVDRDFLGALLTQALAHLVNCRKTVLSQSNSDEDDSECLTENIRVTVECVLHVFHTLVIGWRCVPRWREQLKGTLSGLRQLKEYVSGDRSVEEGISASGASANVNLLLSSSMRLDFGLAKAMEAASGFPSKGGRLDAALSYVLNELDDDDDDNNDDGDDDDDDDNGDDVKECKESPFTMLNLKFSGAVSAAAVSTTASVTNNTL